ncbi:hypothetical protein M8A51_13495 [Schlegelella sp. S2-27]|uniref:Uncharacterized protein n=1 Tax=Caldimonas mangrovi TaxID=2944811 RepID=A0ABT0YP93_9BURK|nr:hypothetical protein [Caldimonas mangrovi]MCM5680541.1 hypothetical protein [Caldimonas mangrovi]
MLSRTRAAQSPMRANAATHPETREVVIDVEARMVRSGNLEVPFALSERHRRMFLDGLDVIGATLQMRDKIEEFGRAHWAQRPWLHNVAARTMQRLTTDPVTSTR